MFLILLDPFRKKQFYYSSLLSLHFNKRVDAVAEQLQIRIKLIDLPLISKNLQDNICLRITF